jgi:PAS domain S-box-containing protein
MTTEAKENLRIVNLEDNLRDAELNRELLQASGISCQLTRVDTRESFAAAMAGGNIDLVLAEYRLAGFDGLSALELVKEKWPGVPFIFMTGPLGEEAAVETLTSGAADYVLKQNPDRLPQAVRRAISESQERRERRAAGEALRESEAKFRNLSENLKEMIYRLAPAGLVPVYVNRAVESVYGYTPHEWCRDETLREKAFHPDDRARITAHFTDPEKLKAGGTLEYRIVRKDGAIRWVEDSYSIERDRDGKIVSINGVLYDTTERKTAQEALWRERVELGVATRELVASDEELREYLAKLYQSEEKYRRLMQSAHDAIFIADAETGLIIDVNQQAGKLLDLPLDQIKGMHQSQLHPPEEAGHYRKIFKEHLKNGRAVTEDIYVWRRDGTRVPVEISSSIVEFEGRQLNQGVFRDITERKLNAEALRKSDEFIQSIIRHSPIAIAVRDKKGRLLSYNQAWVKIWGMTSEGIARHTREVKGVHFRQLFGHLGSHLDEVERLFANGGSLLLPELELDKPNPGGARWIRQYFYTINDPQGGVDRIVILTDDITERKQAEEALRESEAFGKSIISQLPAGITVRRVGGKLLLYNEAWKNIWQLNEEQIKIKEQICLDYSFNERYPFLAKKFPGAELQFQAGQSFVVPEIETGEANPKAAKWISLLFYPLRDKKGTVDKMVTVTMDITQHKLAEKKLYESEQRYRNLVDLSPDAVVVHSGGKVLFANPACLRMLGIAGLDAVIGRDLLDFVHPDYRHLVADRVKIMSGENTRVPLLEEKFLRADGTAVDVEVAAGPITWEGAPAIQVAFRDITERKQAGKKRRKD